MTSTPGTTVRSRRGIKAQRLLDQGKVGQPTEAIMFPVEGDTGSYHVAISATVQFCTCPASGRCSHIEAVVACMLATQAAA